MKKNVKRIQNVHLEFMGQRMEMGMLIYNLGAARGVMFLFRSYKKFGMQKFTGFVYTCILSETIFIVTSDLHCKKKNYFEVL